MKNSARVTYNKIVNIAEDGEISVLSDVFMYKDGFKGATGNTFYPVSKEYYEERTSLESVTEMLEDNIPSEHLEECYLEYENPFEAYAEDIINYGDVEGLMFDNSYSGLWDMLRDELGLSENEAYIFECVGGGRMFDKNFQGNYNPHLSDIIRKYEN